MKIVIIDNYDSFTYNLVHLVEEINQQQVTVFLNDEFELEQLQEFDKIILSPGPGVPEQAGKTLDVIKLYQSTKSILGVCLGLQAIGIAFGSKLKNLSTVFHGIETDIFLTENDDTLFKGISMPMKVGRYHSWVIDEKTVSKELVVTAVDGDKNIMAAKHTTFDVQGVQFHPESIMTPDGKKLMSNWMNK